MPTVLPMYVSPALKMPYAALPMSSAAMPGILALPSGNVTLQLAVLAALPGPSRSR